MNKKNEKLTTYSSSGGRKKSVARVHLTNNANGIVLVNGIEPIKFFHRELLVKDMLLPLEITNTLKTFDVNIKVNGGGKTGQAGAARLALAKALLLVSEEHKLALRQNGLLTRDARIKERKKYGLKAARRAPQFSKR